MLLFSNAPIDRYVRIRSDISQVNVLLQQPESRILVWHNEKLIIRRDNSLYFVFTELQGLEKELSDPVYLGRHENVNYFAYQLNHWHYSFDDLDLLSLRSASLTVTDYHLGLLFYSQAVLNWHRDHSFCAKCGSHTRITHSGHGRKCNNSDCSREHYPRIDPAVIFSIINNTEFNSRILLARQSGWDEKRHSVPAGFVEPGESLEDAVKREGYEEVGLELKNIRYVASQPWPFPGSIMLGFSCETCRFDISLIDHELESASWFSANEIELQCTSRQLKMPFPASISWHLIDRWFTQQKGYSLNQL